MNRVFKVFDRRLERCARGIIGLLAFGGVLLLAGLDYLTGYELSMSVFYLVPVALGTWYGGKWIGFAAAILSSVSWYFADAADGHPYSYPGIAVWNSLMRLGFYIITTLLLSALHESLRRQRQLARTDALTGLYSRRAFEGRLKHDLALGQRRKSALTLAYVDLDDFKAINDTYGHPGGDALLRLVGQVLRMSVRTADTAARIGGDEFALIMPDADAREAQHVVPRMTLALRAALDANGYQVTCSVGVVTFLESATTPAGVLAAADNLMYQVKRNGKGAVAYDVISPGQALRSTGNAARAPL